MACQHYTAPDHPLCSLCNRQRVSEGFGGVVDMSWKRQKRLDSGFVANEKKRANNQSGSRKQPQLLRGLPSLLHVAPGAGNCGSAAVLHVPHVVISSPRGMRSRTRRPVCTQHRRTQGHRRCSRVEVLMCDGALRGGGAD